MDWNRMSDTAVIAEFGERIKKYRLRKNLTQYELSELAGISIFSVAQVERGKPVSFALIISILRALILLDNLEMVIPEMKISPVELLKMKGETRKRGSGLKKK